MSLGRWLALTRQNPGGHPVAVIRALRCTAAARREPDHLPATSLCPWSKSAQALPALLTRPFGCARAFWPDSHLPRPDAGDRVGPLPPGYRPGPQCGEELVVRA